MFDVLRDEVAGLGDEALVARMVAREDERRRGAAEDAVLLAELQRRRVHRRDGHPTLWGMLRGSFGWSNSECLQRTRLSRLVDHYPDVGEYLHAALVPVAHAAEIARGHANPRCGDQIGDVLGTLLIAAPNLDFEAMRTVVGRWEMLADTNGAHRDRDHTHQQRNAHLSITTDGIGYLDAMWADYDAARAHEIFERFCHNEFLADWHTTTTADGAAGRLPRTPAQQSRLAC